MDRYLGTAERTEWEFASPFAYVFRSADTHGDNVGIVAQSKESYAWTRPHQLTASASPSFREYAQGESLSQYIVRFAHCFPIDPPTTYRKAPQKPEQRTKREPEKLLLPHERNPSWKRAPDKGDIEVANVVRSDNEGAFRQRVALLLDLPAAYEKEQSCYQRLGRMVDQPRPEVAKRRGFKTRRVLSFQSSLSSLPREST